MKITQVIIFTIAVALFVGSCYIIWELHNSINSPGFNPNDGQAGFVYIGILLGIVFNLIACAVLIPINLFLGKHKEMIFHSLYLSTNMLLILDGAFLIIARLFI